MSYDLGFMNLLDDRSRRILREVTRRVHLQYNPKDFQSDHECDKVIEALGPEVAANLIQMGIEKGLD